MVDFPGHVRLLDRNGKTIKPTTLRFRIGGEVGERIVRTDDQNIDVDDIIDAKKIQQAKRILYQTT